MGAAYCNCPPLAIGRCDGRHFRSQDGRCASRGRTGRVEGLEGVPLVAVPTLWPHAFAGGVPKRRKRKSAPTGARRGLIGVRGELKVARRLLDRIPVANRTLSREVGENGCGCRSPTGFDELLGDAASRGRVDASFSTFWDAVGGSRILLTRSRAADFLVQMRLLLESFRFLEGAIQKAGSALNAKIFLSGTHHCGCAQGATLHI